MLRSGRSVLSAPAARSQQKRGGFWGYGRPRWGSGHMLRSGRSDPSLRLGNWMRRIKAILGNHSRHSEVTLRIN